MSPYKATIKYPLSVPVLLLRAFETNFTKEANIRSIPCDILIRLCIYVPSFL